MIVGAAVLGTLTRTEVAVGSQYIGCSLNIFDLDRCIRRYICYTVGLFVSGFDP